MITSRDQPAAWSVLVYVGLFARALDHRESEYLFGNARGPWDGEELTQALKQITSRELGARTPARDYKQTQISTLWEHMAQVCRQII
jgi:hypothetical protein